MTTAVIVQARMGSSRLPGKVMRALAGRTVLAEVLDRCRAVPGADGVVCAVPNEPASAPIEAEAERLGVTVFRGSEKDVLDRYLGAARAVNADVIMRVTSDCPLIDPDICGEVLALRARHSVDYAANNLERTFPHGLECEAFTMASLREAASATAEPYDREHVTPWLRRAPHLSRSNLVASDPRHSEERWTLDYPEDLAFLTAVFEAFPAGSKRRTSDVLEVLDAHQEFRAINACHRIAVTG
jgi:spore coat polysaccharide biosynthesis protein SpsF